jgi:hypothetical protein
VTISLLSEVESQASDMSPFKSKAQMKWMFVNMPDKAKEWTKETKHIKRLPDKVK